jgi:Protein of unknown function (DUF3828)
MMKLSKGSIGIKHSVLVIYVIFASASSVTAGPLELIQYIYGSYPPKEMPSAWHKAKKNLPSIDNLPLSSETLSLLRRWNKMNTGEICIDVDPVSDSQDPAVEMYRILSSSNSLAQVEIKSNYTSGIKKSRITYSIKNENGRWVVDDVGGIKKELKQCLVTRKK